MERINSYVVFEDDAGFVPDFTQRLEEYVSELPDDWGMAYLGGQHLRVVKHPPKRISEHVYRPYNVNRTHAFMVRGRATMQVIYRHLTSNDWHNNHHIDHHLGRLIQRRYEMEVEGTSVEEDSIPVYTPDRWLCGQLPTLSNICGRRWEETRFFNHAKDVDHSQAPFFAVLGPHRSGTSCVAMVLHHLGIHMGNSLVGYESTGGGEAQGLAYLCEQAMPFPSLHPRVSDSQLTNQLKNWIGQRRVEAVRKSTSAGGKYPHLCRMVSHLHEAIGNSLRIIAVDRSIEASVESLKSRSRKHPGQWYSAPDEVCEQLQHSLLNHREQFICEHPEIAVHRINFVKLTENSEQEVVKLIDFLGIEPSAEQFKTAIAHINPELRRFG